MASERSSPISSPSKPLRLHYPLPVPGGQTISEWMFFLLLNPLLTSNCANLRFFLALFAILLFVRVVCYCAIVLPFWLLAVYAKAQTQCQCPIL